jgi:hypothetical protein
MSQPYFSVGEDVILQSVDRPEYNGTQTVEGILPEGIHHIHPARAWGMRQPFNYKLVGIGGYGLPEEGRNPYFGQSALRKKPPPSKQGFEEFMGNIKEGILEEVS